MGKSTKQEQEMENGYTKRYCPKCATRVKKIYIHHKFALVALDWWYCIKDRVFLKTEETVKMVPWVRSTDKNSLDARPKTILIELENLRGPESGL